MFQIQREVPEADLVIKKLDLSSLESVRECAKDVNENESRLDILVNNAGVERKINEYIDQLEE